MKDEFKDLEQEYGVKIVTPQDRLDSYMRGLELIRGQPGCESAEASQWETIGDQYRRMNQLGLARAAYQSAINALQKVPTSADFKAEEKLQWEKELQVKLKDLKSK